MHFDHGTGNSGRLRGLNQVFARRDKEGIFVVLIVCGDSVKSERLIDGLCLALWRLVLFVRVPLIVGVRCIHGAQYINQDAFSTLLRTSGNLDELLGPNLGDLALASRTVGF